MMLYKINMGAFEGFYCTIIKTSTSSDMSKVRVDTFGQPFIFWIDTCDIQAYVPEFEEATQC